MASAMLGSLTGNDGDSYYNSLDWDTGSDNAEDVPSYKIDTSQDYGGVGYTPYQQSYTTENKPSWMQGIWDMPEWGYCPQLGCRWRFTIEDSVIYTG